MNNKENNGSNAAKKYMNNTVNKSVSEKIQKERETPIFEDYEIVENGKAVCRWMLSLNGMYISGITDEQMKKLSESVGLVMAHNNIL